MVPLKEKMMNNVRKYILPLVLVTDHLVLLLYSKFKFSVFYPCVIAAMRQSMLDEIERDFEGILTYSNIIYV